jgi:hypothetical protein
MNGIEISDFVILGNNNLLDCRARAHFVVQAGKS